jgi:hypothetical protein
VGTTPSNSVCAIPITGLRRISAIPVQTEQILINRDLCQMFMVPLTFLRGKTVSAERFMRTWSDDISIFVLVKSLEEIS